MVNENAATGKGNLSLAEDDCKVLYIMFMVSLSNHGWVERASFDKLRMSGHQMSRHQMSRLQMGGRQMS